MFNIAHNIAGSIASNIDRCGLPAIFKRVAGNLLSVDGSATVLLAILLGVDAPLEIHIVTYWVIINEQKGNAGLPHYSFKKSDSLEM